MPFGLVRRLHHALRPSVPLIWSGSLSRTTPSTSMPYTKTAWRSWWSSPGDSRHLLPIYLFADANTHILSPILPSTYMQGRNIAFPHMPAFHPLFILVFLVLFFYSASSSSISSSLRLCVCIKLHTQGRNQIKVTTTTSFSPCHRQRHCRPFLPSLPWVRFVPLRARLFSSPKHSVFLAYIRGSCALPFCPPCMESNIA
jgi:hypothetical protein